MKRKTPLYNADFEEKKRKTYSNGHSDSNSPRPQSHEKVRSVELSPSKSLNLFLSPTESQYAAPSVCGPSGLLPATTERDDPRPPSPAD